MDYTSEDYLAAKLAGKTIRMIETQGGQRIRYPKRSELDNETPTEPWDDRDVLVWYGNAKKIDEEAFEEWKARMESK